MSSSSQIVQSDTSVVFVDGRDDLVILMAGLRRSGDLAWRKSTMCPPVWQTLDAPSRRASHPITQVKVAGADVGDDVRTVVTIMYADGTHALTLPYLECGDGWSWSFVASTQQATPVKRPISLR